ncbi:MAG TPA: ABC transporter substrate-binding protein [Alphaproteobacteria bacterium]|nr:ABC transporter substrate-binding protein [Alphaproteobacteria bacterium]
MPKFVPFSAARRAGLCLLATAALAASGWARAQEIPTAPQAGPAPLEMMSFPGTVNLPVWVAQDKGFFTKNGVAVKLVRATSVANQITDVMAGKYPLFITAMDNIVAYQEGQGSAPLAQPADMFAFMGVHRGLNSLVVKPELMTYQHLRGHVMAVDSLNSGYAFVLYRLLERNDLELGVDYKVVALGGAGERFAALKAGRIDGTLLAAPNDDEASELGFTILAEPADLTGGYQGSVYGTRRAWANLHPKELLGITRSLIEAHDYIRAEKAGAIAVLRGHIKGLSEERAELTYKSLVEDKGGLNKRGQISVEGVKTVLGLRSDMGQPKKKLTDPYRYIDTSYYDQVIGKR